MKVYGLLTTLLLSGCINHISQDMIERAECACSNHDGLKSIQWTERGLLVICWDTAEGGLPDYCRLRGAK